VKFGGYPSLLFILFPWFISFPYSLVLISSSLIVSSLYALELSMEMNGRKRRAIDECM
jgi:hypothetical protein